MNASVYGPAWCRSGVLTRDAPPNATLSLMQVLNERHVCAALDFDEVRREFTHTHRPISKTVFLNIVFIFFSLICQIDLFSYTE